MSEPQQQGQEGASGAEDVSAKSPIAPVHPVKVENEEPGKGVIAKLEFSSLDGGDVSSDDAEDEKGDNDAPGENGQAAAASSDDEEEVPSNMCSCCGEEERVAKSLFGKECKRAVNNVENKEAKETGKKGERWEKWQRAKKSGGGPLHAIIMAYRHACKESQGRGKDRGGANFDFAYHYEQVLSRSKVTTGEKLVYMTLKRWLKIAWKTQEMAAKVAQKKWDQKEKQTPPYQQKKNSQGVLMLPMPTETFIVGSNSAEHIKGMQLQTANQKKLDEKKISDLEKKVSAGQLGFGDKAFAKVGGAELLGNAQTGLSVAFAPDADCLFGTGPSFRTSLPSAPPAPSAASAGPTSEEPEAAEWVS